MIILQMRRFWRSERSTNYPLWIFRLSSFGSTGRKIFLLLASSLFCCQIQAQQDVDYSLHSNIIYRFTKYVNWPENEKTGDFIIGIIGDSPLFDELTSFSLNRKVGNQKIVVEKLSASASSYNCQILFISEEESGRLKRITSITAGTPILIVSESEGLAHKGSCINFIIVDDHLKIEINKNNIEQRNLSIASDLLSLGIIVK